jgi:hypothetical protein
MVTCRSCNGNIPDDGRFCPYCGKPRSFLITNYDLPTNVSNQVYLTSGAISTYVATGSVNVAAAEQHPDSPFLDFGAREFKTKLATIPHEFAQKIREGEEAIRRYDQEIERHTRASEITTLIGNTNAAFQGKRRATLFREDDQRVIDDLHLPCKNEADFIVKIARVAALFEVDLAPLQKLVHDPKDLRSVRLVEKWLQQEGITYDTDMIQTWINIVDLRNMRPLHPGGDAERLEEIADFFGSTLPPDYEELWNGILNLFLKSLEEWNRILRDL